MSSKAINMKYTYQFKLVRKYPSTAQFIQNMEFPNYSEALTYFCEKTINEISFMNCINCKTIMQLVDVANNKIVKSISLHSQHK